MRQLRSYLGTETTASAFTRDGGSVLGTPKCGPAVSIKIGLKNWDMTQNQPETSEALSH